MGKYANLFRRATESVDYWTQFAIRGFVRDLASRMDTQGIKRADLAAKIGSSPAYVTKVLRGDANFTLETMTKLAMAVGARVQVNVVDRPAAMMVPVGAQWGFETAPRHYVTGESVAVLHIRQDHIAANEWTAAHLPISTITAESQLRTAA